MNLRFIGDYFFIFILLNNILFIDLITMSLTLLNRKFENLHEREKEIN